MNFNLKPYNKMCQHCQELDIYESIQSKDHLDQILSVLKEKSSLGNIKTTCLISQKDIQNFEAFNPVDPRWEIIDLKFHCTNCQSTYHLFADTKPIPTGFFSPK